MLKDSIKNSEILKLNKPETMVKRRVPYKFDNEEEVKRDIDKRTVYVENLPEDSTHESVAEIFQNAGKILHVSLPKFSDSKAIKGFGFIEF